MKRIKYLIILVFFFLIILLFNSFRYDTIYNFGMSSSIINGRIPYKDINMIIPPLYPFLMSVGLLIKNIFLIYIIEQSILLTLFYYMIEKILKDKVIIVLLLMTVGYCDFFFPNYNFFIVFLLTILLYFEKINKSDYIIGLILGLLFLSKHNIGSIVYLVAIITPFSIKKALKRTITFIIPIVLFVIYLIITNTLYKFIDLSVLGLSDFTNKNFMINGYIILVLFVFIYNIYCILKNPRNKYYYYVIPTYFFIIPICNRFHFVYFLVSNLIIMLSQSNFQLLSKKVIKRIIIILIITNLSYYFVVRGLFFEKNKIIENNQLSGYLISNNYLNKINNICKKYNKYGRNTKIISDDSMLIDLYNNNKITYFDIPLYGNFGKNGLKKMKEKIKKDKGSYYFVSTNNNHSYQMAYELIDFVKNNYYKVDSIEEYDIYYIN